VCASFGFISCTRAALQVMLNPFHASTTRITSKAFDTRVKALAKRMLA
jgi:hypothetical protein